MSYWGWKLASGPDDALRYVNGSAPYDKPVGDARIAVTRGSGGVPLFYIFYTHSPAGRGFGAWEWKRSDSAADVEAFLNGRAPYAHAQPVADAEVCAVLLPSGPVFYIFYTHAGPTEGRGRWGYARSETPESAVDYLNGHAPAAARIAALPEESLTAFYIFHKSKDAGIVNIYTYSAHGAPNDITPILDAHTSASGDIEIVGGPGVIHAFLHRGTRKWPQSAPHNEQTRRRA